MKVSMTKFYQEVTGHHYPREKGAQWLIEWGYPATPEMQEAILNKASNGPGTRKFGEVWDTKHIPLVRRNYKAWLAQQKADKDKAQHEIDLPQPTAVAPDTETAMAMLNALNKIVSALIGIRADLSEVRSRVDYLYEELK